MAVDKNALNSIWRTVEEQRILGDEKILLAVSGVLGAWAKGISSSTSLTLTGALEPQHQHKVQQAAQGAGLGTLLPMPPSGIGPTAQNDILQKIGGVATTLTELAELFDRGIIFRLRSMLPGNRYPTPRHLVQFMYNLVKVGPNISVADLASGTGGFLIHHLRQQSGQASVLGFEADQEWASLAALNLALHLAAFGGTAELYHDDALGKSTTSLLSGKQVDRVLINPPFEERNQIRLLARALDLLDPNDGRLCTLASAGTLFSGRKEALELRRRLVGAPTSNQTQPDTYLRAVISLPEDACQPYSPIRSHVLLAGRGPKPPELVWFLRAAGDGYRGAQGRDLSIDPDPSELNDYPLVAALLEPTAAPLVPLGPQRPIGLSAAIPFGSDGRVQIVASDTQPLVAARLYEQRAQVYLELALSTAGNPAGSSDWYEVGPEGFEETIQPSEFAPVIELPDGGGIDPTFETAEERHLNQLWEYRFETVVGLRQIALDLGSTPLAPVRLVGVAVERTALQQEPYDLQIDRFLREPSREKRADPLKVMRGIDTRKQRLVGLLDELRDTLSDRRERLSSFPPALPPAAHAQLRPIGRLSDPQQQVWRAVHARYDQERERPIYFGAQQIREAEPEVPPTLVDATLELFAEMGLIVPVLIRAKDGRESEGYRLSCPYDSWAPPEQPAETDTPDTTDTSKVS